MTGRLRWLGGVGLGLVAVAGAGVGLGSALSGSPAPSWPAVPGAATAQLVSYVSCSQLLGQLRAQALSKLHDLGPAGLAGYEAATATPGGALRSGGAVMVGPVLPASSPALPLAASAGTSSAAGSGGTSASSSATGGNGPPSFSTTNDQEAGVDEPDLAKTNGQLLVALTQDGGTLEVAGVGGAGPSLQGSLDLSKLVQATGLFLVGSDAVVLGGGVSSAGTPPSPGSGTSFMPASGGAVGPQTVPVVGEAQSTEVVVVDLSDPARPTVLRSFSIQGGEIDARLIAGEVEVVVGSSPTVPLVVPAGDSASDQLAALSADKTALAASSVAQWLPSVTSEPNGITSVAPCSSAMHTVDASGTDTIGIVPIDPSSDQPGPEVTVVGDAGAVYASTSFLYVAFPDPASGTGGAVPPTAASGGTQTTIDAFDLSNPAAPAYAGSGTVPGTLIGQYAMSEYGGDLRVATTLGTPTPAPQDGAAPSVPSDNGITVLALKNGALVPVGQVVGLGTGEAIYAVRFEGPLAYVVTFQQTDPLYVVDLSDPTHPQVAGQLPLTGYSSFLEPLANGLLLGVGQAVNADLQTDGLQVSLFDVANPADPTLVDKDVIPGTSSGAEQDPHALLYWAATGLVVLPVNSFGGCSACSEPPVLPPEVPAGSGSSAGALSWRVSDGGLGTAVPISQPPGSTGQPAGVERALVVGDMLYTVSESGILASDLSTLAPVSWMPYS